VPNEIAAWFGLGKKEWGDEPSKAKQAAAAKSEEPDMDEDDEDETDEAANGNGGGDARGLDVMAPERALRILERYHVGVRS